VAGTTSQGIGTVIATKGYTTSAEGITGVAVDSMGNIYIPDGYAADPSRVIKVTAAGAASLLTPAGITFSRPEGATADGMGNLYIADGGHNRIVEITTAGVASVLAFNSLPSPRTSLTIPATRTHARPLLLFLQARHATLRWCLLRNRWAA
jgi:hypothetical protein